MGLKIWEIEVKLEWMTIHLINNKEYNTKTKRMQDATRENIYNNRSIFRM